MRRTLIQRCWARGDSRPSKAALFPVGSKCHGFTVTEVTPLPDLRMTHFCFVHDVTGSVVHHLDSNDTNNAFCMGFGTPATSDRGTTHVLEHTALCGSAKYPTKDPFFHMLRRSLSTFMNAMTGADYTLYPFATVNTSDYNNLLGVYLDAVFKPLLRADDFRQEGHRLEPAAPAPAAAEGADTATTTTLAFNGVVYNEMRGVVSEPARHFVQELQRAMLPGTHYRHLSGGNPPDVLDLTHEELIAYHRRHYSPWNAVTLTYGDMDPQPTLAALDAYFTDINATSPLPAEQRCRVTIPTLSSWREAPDAKTITGPSAVLGEPEQQSKILVSYGVKPAAAGDGRIDFQSLVRLTLLDTLLTDGPASPMYKALISEGNLGQQYAPMTGFASYYSTPLLSFGVGEVNRNEVAPAQVETAVASAIQDAIKNGFDPRRVESTVFQSELQQRHRSASYGVNTCIGLAAMAITLDAHPAKYLNWLPLLKEVAQNPAVLQEELAARTDPASATHRTTLVMHADKEYAAGLQKEIDAKLAVVNAQFKKECEADPNKAAAFKADHEAWLQRVRAPQSADVLPTLQVSDIPLAPFKEPDAVMVHDGVELITTDANGLVYVNVVIPFHPSQLRALAQADGGEGLLRLPIMQSLLASLGDEQADFEEFDVLSQLTSTGFSFGTSVSQRIESNSEFVCGTTSGFYTTADRLPKALNMLRRLLMEPRVEQWSKKEREYVSTMVCSRAASKADGIQRKGNSIANMSAYACRSFAAGLHAQWSGLPQAQFLHRLQQALTNEAEAEATVDALLEHRKKHIVDLQTRAHVLGADVWAVCDGSTRDAVGLALRDFRQSITNNTRAVNVVPLVERLNDADAPSSRPKTSLTEVPLPINTKFVAQTVFHDLAPTSQDHLALRVACGVLKSEFLHQQVRELGGAYGVSAESSFGGVMGGLAMTSYRDPSPSNTLNAFKQSAEWLSKAENVTARRVDEAKLSLFSRIDHPVTADSYGTRHRLSYLLPETQQQIRRDLLAITAEDVRRVAPAYFDVVGRETSTVVLVPEPAAAAAPQE